MHLLLKELGWRSFVPLTVALRRPEPDGTDEGVQVLLSNLLMATRASATAAATCPNQP